ncbi:cation:proton antiporter [Desulfonema ishimotonii]|uniref:Cation:proton antiporter n=1 Tax=Desulfonema ishimotonii TaxID=45657 RepID=A0A401G3P3_9BACT|nr:cation:proton antiporter [Desulfonema ishimotonii]GBC63862.1 cation:proton antiporter [Desulfonema ishimotonii]
MNIPQQYALPLVALAVLLLPGVSRILRIPAVVSEILFGVLLGRSVLRLEFGGDWLPFLAEFGFLLLMFQAGMEIDFSTLRQQSRGQIFFQILFFLATLGLSFLAAFMMGSGMFMALVLSTTSLGLVMPTLREAGLNKTELGQNILIAATLADFLTLFGITFFILFVRYGISWHFILPVPLFFGFGLMLKLGRLWAWWHPAQAEQVLGIREDSQEIGVRLCIALLFLFVGVSELVHLEPVLGAFLGGSLLSYTFREKANLETKLSALGFGFLIPVFFIHVGMQFDLSNVLSLSQIIFTAKLLVCALGVKLIPSLLLLFRGRKVREVFQTGFLLSSRLSLIIAAASIGVQNGLLTEDTKDAIVFLALITCFIGPTLFRAISGTPVSSGK